MTRMAYASTGCSTRAVADGEGPDPLAGLPGTPIEMLGDGRARLAAVVAMRNVVRLGDPQAASAGP